ncbi:hypothetical protein BRD11_06470 [Halobacteriales archaeon SW_12_69_24]|nr:MAG: hypothetical protein BRD11_06470 [Halobacteriales archaeon SW_12_69_24]
MEWTRPLSLALTVLVAALVGAGALEAARTTLGTGEYVTAAAAVLGFVGVIVVATVAIGAKSLRWLGNPDSYW